MMVSFSSMIIRSLLILFLHLCYKCILAHLNACIHTSAFIAGSETAIKEIFRKAEIDQMQRGLAGG
jgi:hypothetical protein